LKAGPSDECKYCKEIRQAVFGKSRTRDRQMSRIVKSPSETVTSKVCGCFFGRIVGGFIKLGKSLRRLEDGP
jgi:hypothetical protein